MCGIYGQVNKLNPEQLAFLEQQLLHRGPDERHWKEYAHINFFHARLSILDAAGGSQPMETERFAIVYNGEIYNHQDLRRQFGLKGKTRSDTETLLLLYEKLGVDMLSHLDGMFAFALYDKQNGEIILARDRMGEKPLYYLGDENKFCFASELNTLSGVQDLIIRSEALVQFLVSGWIGPETTVYHKVFHVLPGHYVKVKVEEDNRRSFTTHCWWTYEQGFSKNTKPKNNLIEELFELLKTSIQRRVESSDLPVGCFLSGGLDSSIVATLASFIKAPLPTYTFVFEDEYNEGPRAALLAQKIQTQHREIPVNYKNIQNDIGQILQAYGEPYCDDSAIPSYYIAREAKKHNTVIINGDGGDELFGGYRRYVPLAWPEPVKRMIRGVSKNMLLVLPVPQKKISQYNYLYRLAQLLRFEYPDKYLAATTDLFYESAFFQPGYRDEVSAAKHWIAQQFNSNLRHLKANASSPDTELRQFMHTDIQSLLPVVLLKKVDISTMAFSLESRTVFFMPELLKFSATLTSGQLVNGGQTKLLLRQLAASILPRGMARLPKRGFEAPLIKLVDQDLQAIIREYVLGRQSGGIVSQLFTPQWLQQLWQGDHRFTPDRRSKMLYALFCLEYWHCQNNKM